MKRFLISLFLIAFLNSILEFILPWYVLAIVCFIIGLIARLSTWQSFLSGFLGIGLSWLILILIYDMPNHHFLSTRISKVFSLGENYWLLILISVSLGGIIGGLSTICGRWFNSAE